jgi:uncharacterized protein (DUF2384 family)
LTDNIKKEEVALTADALEDERNQLEAFDDLLNEWREKLLRDLPVGGGEMPHTAEYYDRWRATAAEWSTLINRKMPPALDPEEVAEIRGHLLEIFSSLAEYDTERPLDSVDSTMVHLEASRHVVRDAIDGHVMPDGDARELLRALVEKLPRITRKDLGDLLGTSDRSIQRTLKADHAVEPSRRLLVVARLVELLRRAWTPEGVIAWFFRPRVELEGSTPFDLLDDPGAERRILSAAKQGRAQHGS